MNEPKPDSICSGYAVSPPAFDEMCSADNRTRDHWAGFVRGIENLSPGELKGRHQEAVRLLRENGVTYNLHGDPEGLHRPWELDPIPLIIDPGEWRRIDEGLRQRADLLNLILQDLYGPRVLIREGLLPLELVYLHNGFLRPCDGVRPSGARQLVLCAADLVRENDGAFWVVGDYTQVPSGAGYALENRTAMARIFPDLLTDLHVHRLSQFFRTYRASLQALAAHRTDNPRTGVLTPGPQNETYFEHAYLAAYLGYTLVQGDDLTVRDGSLWLKSLEGLQAMDVILRRVDDADCDPLELRADSPLGTAGLLEAVRRGNVALANPLGSGVLENPGLLAFLTPICRRFLGQDPLLPFPDTWWCGAPPARAFVLDNLQRLVLKTIHQHAHARPVHGSLLDAKGLEAWRSRIQAHPHLYVAQQAVNCSTTPTLVNGRIAPASSTIRMFLAANADGYAVMPGGLCKCTPTGDPAAGATSKDIWVLAPEPQEHVSLWLQAARIEKTLMSSSVLPSRSAENLFWVGRYAERAEGTIRLLRTVVRRYRETDRFGDTAETQCLHRLICGLSAWTGSPLKDIVNGEFPVNRPESELRGILTDPARGNSLKTSLTAMVQAAYAVRHLWSTDSWRVINRLEYQWRELEKAPGPALHTIQDDLDLLISSLMAFAGLNSESMTREQGWLLLDIGRRIERGVFFTAFLRSTLVDRPTSSVEHLLLEAVLATTENIITYRHRYRSYIHLQTVLDLLLQDEANPRSVVYQLNRLEKRIATLPRKRHIHRLSEEDRLALKASSLMRLAETNVLAEADEATGRYERLDGFLRRTSDLLSKTSEILSQTYFSHAQRPWQLLAPPPETAV